MPDRRYDDKEIAAIFRAVTEGPRPPQREVPRDEGLTLADLFSAEAIAHAAQALDVRRGLPPSPPAGSPPE